MEFQKRSRREVLQTLLVLGLPLAASVPVTRLSLIQAGADPTRAATQTKELRRKRTDIAIIGNSMVFLRLSKERLNELVKPARINFFTSGGSKSLYWYLTLKNTVGRLEQRPRVVVILYRDYEFAVPEANLEGRFYTQLQELMVPGDEALLHAAQGVDAQTAWKLPIRKQFDPERFSERMQKRMQDLSMDVATLGKIKDVELAAADRDIFDLENLRSDLGDTDAFATEDSARFTAAPAANFLTQFVALAKELDTKLVFYRVKRRPGADNVRQQSAELLEYTQAFAKWAKEQGCGHVDETTDPRITLAMYNDGDHLHKKDWPAYSEMCVERLQPFLSAALPKP